MACYLFTFHAYGTWLPDRQRGFVRRDGQGIHQQDLELGQTYRQQMTQDIVRFDHLLQQRMIQTLLESTGKQHFRLHGVATDQSHLHILISWTDDRTWEQMHYALKRSLSLALNQIQKQTWFTRSGSRKRVQEQEHFDYLMLRYLRNHKGAQWFEK